MVDTTKPSSAPTVTGPTAREETDAEVEHFELPSPAERFVSCGLLGKGGMGEVHLLDDRLVRREVAKKVIRPAVRDDPVVRARFLREARVQGQLEHPSIVPVHDIGEN